MLPIDGNSRYFARIYVASEANRTRFTPSTITYRQRRPDVNRRNRELSAIGHWGSSSEMPESYGRIACP